MLIFYTTEGCHLCDQALGLLQGIVASGELSAPSIPIDLVDVADDERAFERFGEKIPVMEDEATGEMLCWPFDEADAARYLQRYLERENTKT